MRRSRGFWSVATFLAVSMSACSTESPPSEPAAPDSAPAHLASAPVEAGGVELTAELPEGAVTVEGAAGVAPIGTELVVDALDPVDTGDDAALRLSRPAASITLGDGQQPESALTVRFRIPDGDDTFDGLTDDQQPVVVARSDRNPDVSELLPATWDEATRTLSAETTHLSEFRGGLVDFSEIRQTVEENVEGFFGTSIDEPACHGQPVTIGEVTYDAITPGEKVVYPCLAEENGKLVVSLHSNSSLGWIARSTPSPTERAETTELSVGAAGNSIVYGSILASDVGDGALLHPLGVTDLVYDTADVPRTIDLRVHAAMSLVDAAAHGLSMVWGGNTLLEMTNPGDIVATLDCMGDPITMEGIVSASDREAGDLSRKAIECTTTAGGWAVKSPSFSPAGTAREALGSFVTGIGSLPNSAGLLGSMVQGLGGEFTGRNSATVVLRARGGDAVDMSDVPEEVYAIDRFELDNQMTEPVRAGRKIGPYLYQLSTGADPAVEVSYGWSARTGDDRYSGEHCQITVTLTGPDGERHEDHKSARCSDGYASSFGGLTKFRVTTPGQYTLRLQDAVTGLSAESTFSVER
ncbi:hypothetical protein [Rhodococcus ruber]|uniref:hypothetical protein n=1 Tax=Rhodococcus ruber TaxID=1830 RepID=UPI003D81BAB3